MKSKIVRILFFVLLFVVQVVISDYLNLGPYVYICLIPFIILNIPLSRDTGIVMVEAFAIGLLLDLLSDGVPGLNASAAVITAFCRKTLYKMIARRDRQDRTEVPDAANIGFVKYLLYLSACTALYILAYVLTDCAGISPVYFIFLKFLISSIINILLALVVSSSISEKS